MPEAKSPERPSGYGKLLYDMVQSQLTGQIGDHSALVGRAKDLLGVTTITSTILGVFANDKLFQVVQQVDVAGKPTDQKQSLQALPLLWYIVTGVALAVAIITALLVLLPKGSWRFAPSAVLVDSAVAQQPSHYPDLDSIYLNIARGFTDRVDESGNLDSNGQSPLERNRHQIRWMRRFVQAQAVSVAALAGSSGWIAFHLYQNAPK